MGICSIYNGERKHKDTIKIRTNIEENENENENKNNNLFIQEAIIQGTSNYIPCDKFPIILEQKKHSICKILKENKPIGTGFLCLIPYKNNSKQLTVLFTCNHVLKNEDLSNGNKIELLFDENVNKK
jgi:hypothetical protein